MPKKQELKVVQATQVRKDFQEVIDEVHYTGKSLVISKYGKPWVVVEPLPESDTSLGKAIEQGKAAQVEKKLKRKC